MHEMLPNPKSELHSLTAGLGAASHCQGANLSLMSQIVFDWLDEVFDYKYEPPLLKKKIQVRP